jgi:hypothetical protein
MNKAKRFNICKYLTKDNQILYKVGLSFLLALAFFLVVFIAGSTVHASGLVDETINSSNEYSKYALASYQLDFYVDKSWDWLPWNWGDGIGKQVQYALYSLTDVIWRGSMYLSSATGYMVQEAYSLDFVGKTADAVGKNIQTIAGVSPSGITSGFYSGFLLLFVLIVGIYVAYTGLIKRETTKAIRAVMNFVVIFVISASVIAYAPDYIKRVNELSVDVSTASLDIGTSIIMPDTSSAGKNSVDLIRDSLFSIQIKQPWLLLQFGTSDVDSIGADRVEALVSAHPDTNKGEDREDVVKAEIEDNDNTHLTITKTGERLGMVLFLFLFNIGISIFVLLLTGIMIFSQILFIIYAMFLPVSFLMSTLPTFEGTSKRAIVKLFNTIMQRAGITLVITVAFSISTMLYKLAGDSPFFLIAFLQIVTFGGIFFKLNDLMNMFALRSDDSQSLSRHMMRYPRQMAHQSKRRLGRLFAGTAGLLFKGGQKLGGSIKSGVTGSVNAYKNRASNVASRTNTATTGTGQSSPHSSNHDTSLQHISAEHTANTQTDVKTDSKGHERSNKYQRDSKDSNASSHQQDKKDNRQNNHADKRSQQTPQDKQDSDNQQRTNKPAPATSQHQRPNQNDSPKPQGSVPVNQNHTQGGEKNRPNLTDTQDSPNNKRGSNHSEPIRTADSGNRQEYSRPTTIEHKQGEHGRTDRAYVESRISQTEKQARQQKRQESKERKSSTTKKRNSKKGTNPKGVRK